MRKIIRIAAVLVTITALLAACSPAPSNVTGGNAPETKFDGYVFKSGTVALELGEKADSYIKALGEPKKTFEAPSCAFEGVDKTFYYPGFEVTTFPKDGADYLYTIRLTDDSVETPEGLYIGAGLDTMLSAYGDVYSESGGMYTYEKGVTVLDILIVDDMVASIMYNYPKALG